MKTLQNQWPCGRAALHALRWVEHRLGNGCGLSGHVRDGSPGHDWSVSALAITKIGYSILIHTMQTEFWGVKAEKRGAQHPLEGRSARAQQVLAKS